MAGEVVINVTRWNQHVDDRCDLINSRFPAGQKEQQQSAFKHVRQCAHNKLIQQAKDKQSPDVRAAHQCIKSKVG